MLNALVASPGGPGGEHHGGRGASRQSPIVFTPWRRFAYFAAAGKVGRHRNGEIFFKSSVQILSTKNALTLN